MKQKFICKQCGKSFMDYISRRDYMDRSCSIRCASKLKEEIKRPKEIGLKISLSKLGHNVSKETRKKLSKHFKGKTYEKLMGVEKAEQKKEFMKKKFSGSGNPFYNKLHNKNTKDVISALKKGKTHKEIMGKEKAKKWHNRMSGENSPMWKGGFSAKDYKNFTNLFKRKIRQRDNQVCMMCGIHREKLKTALAIHHIDYKKHNTIPQNCISLCLSCHSKTNYNIKHLVTLFQQIMSERYNYCYSEQQEVIVKYV